LDLDLEEQIFVMCEKQKFGDLGEYKQQHALLATIYRQRIAYTLGQCQGAALLVLLYIAITINHPR